MNTLQSLLRRAAQLRATILFPSTAHLPVQDGALVERIRLFDLDGATPAQCLSFLANLKAEFAS